MFVSCISELVIYCVVFCPSWVLHCHSLFYGHIFVICINSAFSYRSIFSVSFLFNTNIYFIQRSSLISQQTDFMHIRVHTILENYDTDNKS